MSSYFFASFQGLYRRCAGEARTNKVLSQLEETMDESILEEEDHHLICNIIKKVFLKVSDSSNEDNVLYFVC